MKRIALLGAAMTLLGAGCWSDPAASPVAAPVQPPVVEAPQVDPGAVSPAAEVLPTSPSVTPPSAENPTSPASVAPSTNPEPVYATIEMSQDGFKPAQISIKKDTIVRFTNVGNTSMWPASNPHPSHTTYQDFDARRMVKPGETYEFRFKNVGAWGCHDHLSPGLTCRIVVEE